MKGAWRERWGRWLALWPKTAAIHPRKESPERVLWIHAGGHKTGSKAIQNYLYLDGLKTTAPSIHYRKGVGVPDPRYMNCGNGSLLLPLMRTPAVDIGEALEAFLGPSKAGIVSQEDFSFFTPQEWQRLNEAALGRGIELRVVFFIRNLIPFLLSAYDQLVKAGAVATDFSDWAENQPWQHAQNLRNLAASFSEEKIRVVHYDSVKSNLLPAFFSALGIMEPCMAPVAETIGTLNRSLTQAERSVFLFVNRRHGRLVAEALNRGLQAANPRARPEPPLLPAELEKNLRFCFAEEADWVNQTFFGGEAIVGIGASPKPAANRQVDPSEELSVTQLALGIVLDRFAQAGEERQNKIQRRLKSLDRSNLTHPDLPPNFDPAAYLLLNPDLLDSCEPLLAHYLKYGRAEGRKYSF